MSRAYKYVESGANLTKAWIGASALVPGQARIGSDLGAQVGGAAKAKRGGEDPAVPYVHSLQRSPAVLAPPLDLEGARRGRPAPGADLSLRLSVGHEREPKAPVGRLALAGREEDPR